MAKEKVTLTLDTGQLEQLRKLVGARSLSATVDDAVQAHLARLAHLAAVDEWLAEMETEFGPVPKHVATWASNVVSEWDAGNRESLTDAAA